MQRTGSCAKCGDDRFGSTGYCPPCMKSYNRERAQQIKMEVLHAYGLVCVCCRLDHTEFLCIDHIDGGGDEHRRAVGGGSSKIYRWLKKNNYPPGFQVLCANCNLGKERGLCPRKDRCLSLDRIENFDSA